MKMGWISARQTKYGAYVAVYLVVVLAILFAANFLANRYDKTYDATSNKVFSLSDQTKKILANLKQNVTIYYFNTSNQTNESAFGPSPRDLLQRYSSASHYVTVDFVDPVKNPKRALDMKVTQTNTTIVEVNGRREEAKSPTEEQVTNALIRALKGGKRTACFVTGHGEADISSSEPNGFSGAKDALEATNFTTKTISLLEKNAAVPSDCTVLVEAGPKNNLLDVEIAAIKKYVEGGGRALFLIDPETKGVNTSALDKMIGDWGVKVDNNIVVDLSGVGQLFGADELSPLVTSYESQPITQDMKNVACLFPLSRSVEPDPDSRNSNVLREKLFQTTSRSFATSNFASGQIKLDPKRDKTGPFSLAVAGTYRTDKENVQGRFVVVGSSRFAVNATLRFPGGNRDLFLNMMNWLSSDEDLISIRPKESEDRRLSLTVSQMARIFYASVIGFPLLIIVGGTYVWWRRR
ncbi:MAG TPA: GldG family protein [Bryobacterales bacterium]|jgi:ABC-type uncharacterized transport system involved in gliding motility auxiliary subunit|nr:GldG family protein [Bryobacterales bacterium]